MSQDKPIWLRPGPAKKLYQHFLNANPIVDQWLEILRKAWGNPVHPDLAKYPDVKQESLTLPATIDAAVEITLFTPIDTSDEVLIYIHGGGWIAPTAGKHLAWAKKIAHMSKMTVVSVDYRLAPEHPFPAALHDCVTVYQHFRKARSGKIYIGGDSAGGNLAAATTLFCYDNDIVSLIKFCVYVPKIEDWKNPYVSPIYAKLNVMPSTLVLIAEDDPLRDENRAFVKRLKDSDVKVISLEYPEMPHTFYTYPEFLPDQAKTANEDMVRFLLD